MNRRAIVLLSGGLDSTTCLAIATREGFDVVALSFDYGQRHQSELDAARRVAKEYGVAEHVVATIDLRAFGGSALTDDIDVPKHSTLDEIGAGIPVTYVPARNVIFLAFAVSLAEAREARHVFVGVNAVDFSGYPDCRRVFISAFEYAANLATKASVEDHKPLTIHTPLIHLSKAEIVHTGLALGVDYGLTHSCYDPTEDGRPCGGCDSCLLRAKGFSEAGQEDPLCAMR